MQFVALQLKFMNKGVSKSRSFKMVRDIACCNIWEEHTGFQ